MVLVDVGRKNWGFTEQTGFGRFWPKRWFWSILTNKTWFGPQKRVFVDFDPQKLALIDIGRKKVVLVDFD